MTRDQIIREEFERWHTEVHGRTPSRDGFHPEKYYPHSTQAAWEARKTAWTIATGYSE